MNKLSKIQRRATVVTDGLHAFRDRPEGAVFLFTDDDPVFILQRPTGDQVQVRIGSLDDKLPAGYADRIKADLLYCGIYTNNRYEVIL